MTRHWFLQNYNKLDWRNFWYHCKFFDTTTVISMKYRMCRYLRECVFIICIPTQTRYFENDTFMGRKWAPGYGACARKKICHCGKQMDWECRENNWRPVSNFVITPWPFYNFFVERVENSASRFVVSIPDCLLRLPQTGELDKNKVSLLQFVQLFLILRRALFRWLLWKEENVMTSTFLTPSSL